MAESAPLYDYDTAVSADLLARWSALDGDAVVVTDLVTSVGAAAGGVTAVAAAGASLAGAVPWDHGLVGIVGGSVVAVGLVLARRVLGRRVGLSAKDVDTVLAHRTEIAAEQWRSGSAEAVLVARVQTLGDSIAATSAWQDPELRESGLRLDVPEEVRQIVVAASQLHRLRQDLGTPPADGEPGHHDWQALSDELGRSLQVLDTRVDQLESYREQLQRWETAVTARRRGAQLRELFSSTAETLPTANVRSELATEHVAGLVAGLDHEHHPDAPLR